MPHDITLANKLLRSLATPAGGVDTLGVLIRSMPEQVKKAVVRDATEMRKDLSAAHRMILGHDFMDLCTRFGAEATHGQVVGLIRQGMPPFDPLWLEWGSPDAPDYQMGCLVSSVPHPELENVIRFTFVHNVPTRRSPVHQGEPITVLPFCVWARLPGDAFPPGVRGLRGQEPHDKNLEAWTDTVKRVFFGEENQHAWAGYPAHIEEILSRVTVVPHGTAGVFLAGGGRSSTTEPSLPLFADQTRRALFLMEGLPLCVTISLGMLSLSPVRHLVDRAPWARSADKPDTNWRWKLDHHTVSLKRPVRTAEVVRHLVEAPRSDRQPPALHTVMGFWRVRGGRPSCNHVWRPNVDDQGRRIGSLQSICTRCAGVQSWVASFQRGTPERGVISKDFVVETGTAETPRVRAANT